MEQNDTIKIKHLIRTVLNIRRDNMINIKNKIEMIVGTDNTAEKMGSGELPVLATPAMVALIEETCWKSAKNIFGEGYSTVGTKLEISHLSPTPVGMKIWCESELLEEGDRHLTFRVKVYDEKGLIGEGIHERFVVENDKFMEKANAKAE